MGEGKGGEEEGCLAWFEGAGDGRGGVAYFLDTQCLATCEEGIGVTIADVL